MEVEFPAEVSSKFEEYYCQCFYQTIDTVANCIRNRFQQKYYNETPQTKEVLLLKALHEEDFGHKLQQTSSFFNIYLVKTLMHIFDETNWNKRCNKSCFTIKCITKAVSI